MKSIKGQMSEKLEGANERIKALIADSLKKLPLGQTIKTIVQSELQQVGHFLSEEISCT
jgi:hypothetical protein